MLSDVMLKGIEDRVERYVKRLTDYCAEVLSHRDELGLKYIIVFGSFVRGELKRKSDIDVMFLVDDEHSAFDVELTLTSDLSIENEASEGDPIGIDVKVWSARKFIEADTLFVNNVVRDGIVLWRRVNGEV